MGARKHIKAEERKAALKTQYFAKQNILRLKKEKQHLRHSILPS